MSGLNLNCWPDRIKLRFLTTFSRLFQTLLPMVLCGTVPTEAPRGKPPVWFPKVNNFLSPFKCVALSSDVCSAVTSFWSWAYYRYLKTQDGKTEPKKRLLIEFIKYYLTPVYLCHHSLEYFEKNRMFTLLLCSLKRDNISSLQEVKINNRQDWRKWDVELLSLIR